MNFVDSFAVPEPSDDRDPVDAHIDRAKRHAFNVYSSFNGSAKRLRPETREYLAASFALVAMGSYLAGVMRCEKGACFNCIPDPEALNSPEHASLYIVSGQAFAKVIDSFRDEFTAE